MGEEYRPAGQDVQGEANREEPGPVAVQDRWQSTARQLLSGLDGSSEKLSKPTHGHSPERGHLWGGMLPGDSPDINHGDLTRGGLDERGVNLAGVVPAAKAGHHKNLGGRGARRHEAGKPKG